MSRITIGHDHESIEAILEADGHRFARIDHLCWRGRFRSRDNIFPFMVHVDEERGLITMAIIPFMASPEDDDLCKALYDRLLELNQVLFMAKFCIDDDLDVVLSVSHPTKDLQASELRDGLSALLYYADVHRDELLGVISEAS